MLIILRVVEEQAVPSDVDNDAFLASVRGISALAADDVLELENIVALISRNGASIPFHPLVDVFRVQSPELV